MLNLLKDIWLLFGRLFPCPTKPGLRRVGDADRSSPVLVTCNFELTVRKVIQTLERDGIAAWLLVAPTKGINVWCAAGGGHFTTDTVVSIVRSSGVESLVDHRRLILPQLSATGVNFWDVKQRTGWKPRFGPADVKHIGEYLQSGKPWSVREHRQVRFPLKDRFVMGTNLGFTSVVFSVLPLLVVSVWVSELWWKSIPIVFVLSVLSSVLAFWLPGRAGVRKGLSLGLLASAGFVVVSQTVLGMQPWATLGWAGWIVLLSVFVGFELPGMSPLWRQNLKEVVLGVRSTLIAVIPERCNGCGLCDGVCPANVFERDPNTTKFRVLNLDACQACGACIENCPTQALDNNFSTGVCSCPTCAAINTAGALLRKAPRKKAAKEKGSKAEPLASGSCCSTIDQDCEQCGDPAMAPAPGAEGDDRQAPA